MRKETVLKCQVCNKEFFQNPKYRQKTQKYCSVNCQAKAWRDANPEKVKEIGKKYRENNPEKVALKQRKCALKRRYGIDLEKYDSILKSQNGGCAICGLKKEETLAVDHNHKTGGIRGLLCSHCNHVLGFAEDNIELLNKTIDYLTNNK